MYIEIFDTNINENKEFKIAFSVIFGFNLGTLKYLNKVLGLNIKHNYKIKDFKNYHKYLIKEYLSDAFVFDINLKRDLTIELEKYLELNCYKKNRFYLKLPVRGQRTHTNAKTVKRTTLLVNLKVTND